MITMKFFKKQTYYLIYTICFVIAASLVFSWYFLNKKFLIWTVDGWSQHYKALVYYSQYLRNIVKNLLLNHELIIPRYDFSFGEGGDILQILHYYVIGDPFSVFCVFIPTRLMYLYYTAAVLLRLYLSGIAFSALCFQTGHKSRYAVLAGSISYVFGYYSIFMAGRHPYFLNPLLYLPLLLLGIEKIIKRQRPYLFILTVTVSAMSNFYFFYVLAFISALYVCIRGVSLYKKDLKKYLLLIFQIGMNAAMGLLLSAVILLPVCYAFLSDARGAGERVFHLFYPLSYYTSLPADFLTLAGGRDYQLYLGFAVPILPAVFLMFYKRGKYTILKAFFITCAVIVSIPALGQILNGFSYMSNRWCFAFALLTSYLLTVIWPDLMQLKTKEALVLGFCVTVYFTVCLLLENCRTKQAFSALILCMVVIFILFPAFERESMFSYKRKQQLVLLTVFASVILNSFWQNSPSEGNEAQGMGRYIADILNANESYAVAKAADLEETNEFYRYSGRDLTANANVITGISSTQYYWTLSNSNIFEYRKALELIENTANRYIGYDDRTALNTLASVRYFSVPDGDNAPVPYGFTLIDTEEMSPNYHIYRNDYALPFSYSYDNFILADTLEGLSSVEKQETMLKSVVLSEGTENSEPCVPVLNSRDIPFTTVCNGNGITQQGNSFVVTEEASTVTITFDGLTDSETYVEIAGLNFEASSKYDLYFGDEKLDPEDIYNEVHWGLLDLSDQTSIKKERWLFTAPTFVDLKFQCEGSVSKALRYYTKDHSYYVGRHDFAVNLGYNEEALSSLEISFPSTGIYSFDSIKVICQPMESYPVQVEALKGDTLQNVVFGTDTVTGEINLDTPKLLCLSIPYSRGWRAYVDGREAKLYQANIKNMALDLKAGYHTVELIYETPFLRTGIYLSLFGLILFIILIVFWEKRVARRQIQL